MAGRGPAPKSDDKRARRNKPNAALTIVESEPVAQPELPESAPGGEPWHPHTLEWWERWGDDPLAGEFRASDWSELMDCAAIHSQFWSGDFKLAGELRLRTGKFGATQEDRARLRIQFAAADEADEKRRGSRSAADSRGAYQGLKVVD